MSNYLKGNTWSTVYTQVLGVGATGSHGGLDSSLDDVWTDDGAGGKNLAAFQLSTAALQMTGTNKLHFNDDGVYIHSLSDAKLNLVADGEIDFATADFDINATGNVTIDGSALTLTGTTTLASATTISGALTCNSTVSHTGAVTLASGIKLQFVDGNEYISGDSTDLTIGSGTDINLTATADVNIPSGVGLTFGNDGEKIEGDGTNLAVSSSGALNLTGAAASTWKTTAGAILVDAEAAALTLDGHGGVNIAGTNGSEIDLTTTGALDLNSGAFTLDGSTLSIDGTDDSNFTVTGSGKTLLLQSTGGGAAQQTQLKTAGTGASAMEIFSTAGGIDITSVGGAGKDIDITATGSINISSTENAADGIVLNSTAGGIDIIAAGTSGEDIDITATGSSVNITATEDNAGAIYIRENGGTSGKIKIHADQGTSVDSIQLISDDGGIDLHSGKTGAISNMASDSPSNISNAPIQIGVDTADCGIAIGNSTSSVLFGDNVKIAGDLHVVGSVPSADTLSASSIARFTLQNTDEENSVGGRDSEFLFKGESGSGTVHEMAAITVSQQTSDEYHSQMIFRLNDSTSVASLAATGGADDVLTLTHDKTATFGGAITTTSTITGGQINADNLRLDGNVLSSQDSNGNITLTPNGSGAVVIDGCSILVDSNTVIDTGVGTGTDNTIFGADAGDAMEAGGTNNVLFGHDAGTAITTGSANTCIGNKSGDVMTTQSFNVAIGSDALGSAAQSSLTAVGTSSLQSNSTGANNTALGYQSGLLNQTGSKNTFIGNQAGHSNTSADFNTAVGHRALYASNKTADDNAHNTAVGCDAGDQVSTGYYNTIIGSQAGDSLTSGNSNTIVGYNVDVDDAARVGSVLIGNNFSLGTASDNFVEIGNATNTMKYDLDGGDLTVTSDIRTKTNIKDSELGLKFINDLRPITYETRPSKEYGEEFGIDPEFWNEKGTGKVWDGLIAQEVKQSIDKLGVYFSGWNEASNTKQSLQYGKFVMPLINAVKELSSENDKLKQENEAFESRLAAIEAKLNDAGK
tara:strand:+ start:3237 stop:6341 length:3105 start_codon:yes stop_codon:yes gene_type:complete